MRQYFCSALSSVAVSVSATRPSALFKTMSMTTFLFLTGDAEEDPSPDCRHIKPVTKFIVY